MYTETKLEAVAEIVSHGKKMETVKDTLFSMCLFSNHYDFKRSTFNRELSSGKMAIEFAHKGDAEKAPVVQDIDGPALSSWKTLLLDNSVAYNGINYALCQVVEDFITDETPIEFNMQPVIL